MVIYLDVMLYVVTGLYGFLIIFLFAFVINLFIKVKKLSEDDDESSEGRISPRPREPDYMIPKPLIKSGSHNKTNVPDRSYGRSDSPERNFGHNSQPERNHGHRSLPERNQGHNNFRNDDFGGIDFNNRISPDKSFKPSSSHGGSYKNPLFGQESDELENKYDFNDHRDRQHSKPHAAGFRPPGNSFNQPSSLNPKREYQNNNFRY